MTQLLFFSRNLKKYWYTNNLGEPNWVFLNLKGDFVKKEINISSWVLIKGIMEKVCR